jgi:4-amino-4-deoxy-L-arabinose transferase-like glycosyltransferase
MRAGGVVRFAKKFISSPAAIVSVALLVRLIYLAHFVYAQPIPVKHQYKVLHETGSIATSIASGHGYSSPLIDPSGPTAWITPVYPYLLAGAYKIFGLFSLRADVFMRLLNVLFSAATTYAIFLLGRRLFGEASGIVAGWIWAFFWYAIFFPAAWLWDTSLSALMLCLALWATYAVEKRQDWKSWSGFGFLWGLAALVNAAILSVLPGCFLFALYRSRLRSATWWKSAGASALTLALTVAPWIIRNQITFHGQVFFRSNFGLELWLGNNPQVPDSWTWWLHPSDDKTEHEKFLRMGEVPYMQEKQREAWAFIKTHPSDFSRFVFHRFMETWTDSDSFADLWNSGFLWVRVGLILKYALPLLTFSGLLLARRNSPLLALPLLNVVAMFPLVYYLCHTTARYRHPMDPVLCVLTGFTLVSVARAVSEKFFRPAQAVQKQPVSAV